MPPKNTAPLPNQRTICPLFADCSPPVYADEIGAIRVFKQILQRNGQNRRGAEINFNKPKYVRANDGRPFKINPFETTEVDLGSILEVDGEAEYALLAYDNKTGERIKQAARALVIEAEEEEGEEEEEEEEEVPQGVVPMGTMTPQMLQLQQLQQMQSQQGNDRFLLAMIEMLKDARQGQDRPAELAVKMAEAMTAKEQPSAIAEELRAELRSARLHAETEITNARRKADEEIAAARRRAEQEVDDARRKYNSECDSLREQLRTERARAEQRDNEARADLRALRERADADVRTAREKADREVSDTKRELSQQVFALQKENIALTNRLNERVMEMQGKLMQTNMEKTLVERTAEDLQKALDNAQAIQEDAASAAQEAAAADEVPAWLKPLLKFGPMVLTMLQNMGEKVPKQLVNAVKAQGHDVSEFEQQQDQQQPLNVNVQPAPAPVPTPAPAPAPAPMQPRIVVPDSSPAPVVGPAVRQAAPRVPAPAAQLPVAPTPQETDAGGELEESTDESEQEEEVEEDASEEQDVDDSGSEQSDEQTASQ